MDKEGNRFGIKRATGGWLVGRDECGFLNPVKLSDKDRKSLAKEQELRPRPGLLSLQWLNLDSNTTLLVCALKHLKGGGYP